MNFTIEYNRAIELVCAIQKLSAEDWFSQMGTGLGDQNIKKLLDFTPDKHVREWLDNVEAKISLFLKNDLDLLVNRINGFYETYAGIALRQNIQSPEELIGHIEGMEPEKLVRLLFEAFKLNVSFDEEDDRILEALCKVYNNEMSEAFLQIKRYPEEYKERILNLFREFYIKFYKPIEKEMESTINEKLAAHNLMLKADPINFLNVIGLGDYTRIIDDGLKIRIFISYLIDLGLYYFTIDDTFFMLYGASTEQRFDKHLMQGKCKNLFKALADETRVEIIKMTVQRPWYNKELADYFGLSTATLSYHINLLLDLGILSFEPSSNNRFYYTANREALTLLFNASLEELLSK